MKKSKKIKKGTLEVKKCKINNEYVKMEYTGDFESETGENGHKGWICLHER